MVYPLTQAPVKIAILDSGIDLPQSDLEAYDDRIIDVRTWLDGKVGKRDRSCGDDVGHGTHTAALVLDAAPDSHVYIAKIADRRPTCPRDIAKVVLNPLRPMTSF